MNIIKLGLISFIILFLVVTGISLFIPSHVRISRAINMKAGKEAVMGQLNDPVKWKNWYPGMDSAHIYYENGVAKGVSVTGKSTAALVITSTGNDEVIAEFRTDRRPVINGWKIIAHPGSDSLTVQWYMDTHLRWYPWEKFASLLFEKSYGPRMEQGLGTLKKIMQTDHSSFN